jgi:hypothetical protein
LLYVSGFKPASILEGGHQLRYVKDGRWIFHGLKTFGVPETP